MSEVVAQFKLDATKALADLKALANGFTATGTAAQTAQKEVSDSFLKGSNGAKSFDIAMKASTNTIGQLDEKLRLLKSILVEDTRIGSAGFKQVSDEIRKTEQAIKAANAEFDKTPQKVNPIVDGLKKIGAAVVAAFAVDKLISFGKEAITLAASAEGVQRAFAKIGSPEMLQGLRNATNGTVTDLVLMQNAVKASNFKIPLDQLSSLLKYAQMQARATGQDVDYLVESLITGIGRKSVLVLDNLQISAVELRQTLGDVSMETATVGQVAEAVGKIASASFAKMGAQALTTADEIAQMETAWTNFKTNVGSGVIAAFTPIAKALQLVSVDAQKVADVTLATQQMSLIELARELKLRQQIADEALKAYDPRGGGRDELKLAAELLDITQKQFDLKMATRGAAGNATQDEIRESEVNVTIQAKINKLLEEEAKLRASQIRNLFQVDAELKLLNDELGLQETSLQRITAILPLITALEEERKTILGEETEAMKKLRLELEALGKVERKRAEEYNKAQEAEAERLRKQAEDNAKERVKIAQDMAEMLIEIERYLATTSEEIRDVELADNQRFYEYRLSEARKGIEELAKSEEESAAIFKVIQDEKNKADEESQEAHNARIFELNKDLADRNAALANDESAKRQEQLQQFAQSFAQYAQAVGNIASSISNLIQQNYENEAQALEDKFRAGEISEAEYNKKKRRLQKEQAESAKSAAIFEAIINTAMAVVSALTAGPIIGPILAALAAAAGAVQIATIEAQPIPQFAKGVIGLKGEGTGTSDSIHAKLSKGESVITAKQTEKHRDLLTAINKGIGEKYIMDNYVAPMMNASVLNSFDTIHDSAKLNGLTANLKDHNIIAAMDRNRAANVYGFKMLAEKLGSQKPPKRGGYV